MGLDVDVKLRFVVKMAEGEICGGGERLFALLKELAAGDIRVFEPMRVVRLPGRDQLQCTVDSFLRTKTGFERFLSKRKFESLATKAPKNNHFNEEIDLQEVKLWHTMFSSLKDFGKEGNHRSDD